MEQSFRNGFLIQRAAVTGLFHREIKTCFAGFRLELAWAILEPVAYIGAFLLIFGLRHTAVSNGIDYPLFLVTGFIPYFLFKHRVTQVMNAPDGNHGLFYFRQLQPIDTVISRFVVEAFLSTLTFLLFLFAFMWLGHEVVPHRPLEFLTAFFLLGFLGLTLGLCFSLARKLFPDFSKLGSFLMRPLYFLSGIMFSINFVPQEYSVYLMWNPILKCIETIRQSLFHNTSETQVSFLYVWESIVIVMFVGFSLYSLHWKKMIRKYL